MNKNINDFIQYKNRKIKKNCYFLHDVHDFREHKTQNSIRDCVKCIKIK